MVVGPQAIRGDFLQNPKMAYWRQPDPHEKQPLKIEAYHSILA
jgi:hypothetical protein